MGPVSTVDKDVSTSLQPEDVVALGVKWLQVWDLDVLGECCCQLGSRRWKDSGCSLGERGRCQRPGKHPWWIERDGEPVGFRHGALAAVELEQARSYSCAGNRLAAVPGDRVVVLDLDGDRAFRTFVRISRTLTQESFIGAAKTPRGYHVWLRMVSDGWSQASALEWMRGWLGKGMGGLDLRCGDRSYVVWPGGIGGRRRWLADGEFTDIVQRSYGGWEISAEGGWGPVWLAEGEGVEAVQRRSGGGEIEIPSWVEPDLGGQDWAWERLTFGCRRLAEMPAKSGRNNRLNVLAFHQGATCVWLGVDREKVVAALVAAAESSGTHGVVATVNSGLKSGLAVLGSKA